MFKSVRGRKLTSFRYGDGNAVKCGNTTIFHVQIEGKNIMIKTDIKHSDLALSLSNDAVKKANVRIIFSNNTVSMSDQKVNIVFTSWKHYNLLISKTNQLVEDIDRNNNIDHVI